MADQSAYSRIYDLKTAGVDKVLADVNAVIARLEVLGKVKNDVVGGSTTTDTGSAGYEKLSASMDKLTASFEDFAVVQKNVTASMQQGAQALGTNLTAATVGVGKMQAAMSNATQTSFNYSNSIVELGGKLFELKEAVSATQQQLKILGDQYRENQISQEEYEQEGALLTAQLTQQQLQVTQLTALMKALNSSELAYAGSTKEARAQIILLNREQEELAVRRTKDVQLSDEEIAANLARRDAIIAEKNALHDFLLANADKNLARVLNIGNYPTVAAEFSAIKKEMQEIILTGDRTGERFKALEARALELGSAIKEVGAATAQTASVAERFGNIVERMGLRMIANLIIFQALMEIGGYIKEQWQKDAKAAEELTKNIKDLSDASQAHAQTEIANLKVLSSIATDNNEKMEIRVRAVKDLQDKYPDYLGNISKEAILTGQTADAMERLNKALINKAFSEAAIGKVGEYAKRYIEIQDEIDATVKKQKDAEDYIKAHPLVDIPSSTGRFAATRGKSIQELTVEQAKKDLTDLTKAQNDIKKQMEKYQKEAEDFASSAAPLIVGQPDKVKDQTQKLIDAYLAQQKAINDIANKAYTDEQKRQSDLNKSIEDFRKERQATLDKFDKDEADKVKAHLAEIQADQQGVLDEQLLTLAGSYAKKEITDEEYAKRKKEIQSQSNREILNETIKYMEAEIQASKVSDDAKKAMLKEVADYKHKLNQQIISDDENTAKKEKIDTQQIYQGALDILATYANEEIKLLDKRSEYRQKKAKEGLDWNKKVLDSEAQSNQQRLADDKAFALAQNKLAQQKARDDKKRAQSQEILNFALATGNLLASNKDWSVPGLIALAIKEGFIAAKFAIVESEISSAPAYAQGTGAGVHPGGLAWIGDGGEPELIRSGNRYSISPSTATLANLPAGSTVTPFSQISNLGAGLQAPRFSAASSSGGGADNSAAFAEIHGALRTIAAGMANQKIVYEPRKAVRANNNSYYSTVKA